MDKLKILIAGGIGFLAAYLLDPDRGRSRRARIADQAAARARKGAALLRSKVRYQSGVARGIVHRVTRPLRRNGEEAVRGEILLQKIRSEAVGQWRRLAEDPSPVEVFVDEGNVAIVGAVASKEDRDKLIELVLDVEGVTTLEDRLSVG